MTDDKWLVGRGLVGRKSRRAWHKVALVVIPRRQRAEIFALPRGLVLPFGRFPPVNSLTETARCRFYRRH